MTRVLLVVVFLSGGAAAAPAAPAETQANGCAPAVASVDVPERSYALLDVREFDGRVFVYVPEVVAAANRSAAPFDLWLVEGVYGKPFIRTSGSLDVAGFERLRQLSNVRATPVRVTRPRDAGAITVGRQPFLLDIAVSAAPGGADTVTVRMCRAR